MWTCRPYGVSAWRRKNDSATEATRGSSRSRVTGSKSNSPSWAEMKASNAARKRSGGSLTTTVTVFDRISTDGSLFRRAPHHEELVPTWLGQPERVGPGIQHELPPHGRRLSRTKHDRRVVTVDLAQNIVRVVRIVEPDSRSAAAASVEGIRGAKGSSAAAMSNRSVTISSGRSPHLTRSSTRSSIWPICRPRIRRW